MRISQFLADEGVAFETLLHPPAFSAQKRARFLHIPGRNLLKSVLVHGPQGFGLAVLPATRQVSLTALAEQWQGPLRLAGEAEVARWFPDCERGALAPFGSLYDMPTLVDDAIGAQRIIVFPAQRQAMAIRMRWCDFERLERPARLTFAASLSG